MSDVKTLVVGHKNPDTDAICSAIAYAEYLQAIGNKNVEAIRCGEVNSRTDFVLRKAGVSQPRLVTDTRLTVGGVSRRHVVGAHYDDTFQEAFNKMRNEGLRSMPVLREDGSVEGMLSMQKMVELLLPESNQEIQPRQIKTSLSTICHVLGGRFQHAVDDESREDLVLTVAAMSAEVFKDKLKEYPAEQHVVVLGNRPTIQESSIKYGVRALVITGGYELSEELLKLARKNNITVLISPRDTASTTLLMKCAKPIGDAIWTDFISFPENTLVESIRNEVLQKGQVLFPVINEQKKMVGVFSKTDLINPKPARLILVDHNEYAQAVTGASDADIVEVIDHHKLGGSLSSREPIRFIIEPIGSTCSIVANMFKQAGIEPSSKIALCMASGIISDTLFLTSPTTTEADKEILTWLEEVSGADLKAFAEEMFAEGSILKGSSAKEVVQVDCKEYDEDGWKLAVAQVEELELDHFWPKKQELEEALLEMARQRGRDFACLLITDITKHYSLLLTVGNEQVIERIEYPELMPNLFELDGIVSRKKQLMPVLLRILSGCPRGF
ncbi:MAG: putative manganese-dependent inorganic diphosphatase [Verrucomicrobiota bacterium]